MKILELPPRTRRIREPDKEQINKLGTTSAHAENTWLQHYSQGLLGNYLRARGEYSSTATMPLGKLELPPRTRRIRKKHADEVGTLGTTSAHAENTPAPSSVAPTSRNYLRARGEYSCRCCACFLRSELPPRTRRIPSRGDD